MRAINLRLGRECAEFRHIVEHLFGRSLEQPPTAHGEQRVANEHRLLACKVISDMSGGVCGDVDHIGDARAKLDTIPATHLHIKRRDAREFRFRTRDRATGRSPDRFVPAGVIGVPMRVPDLRDLPTALFRFGQHGVGDRWIDGHRFARAGFMHQPDIIVRKNGDADDLERHPTNAPCSASMPRAPAAANARPAGVRRRRGCRRAGS